jgi:CubicO group peptidase (beta-lactamase class C family)
MIHFVGLVGGVRYGRLWPGCVEFEHSPQGKGRLETAWRLSGQAEKRRQMFGSSSSDRSRPRRGPDTQASQDTDETYGIIGSVGSEVVEVDQWSLTMRMIIVLALSLVPSLAFAAGATAISSICGAPAAMPGGWPVAAPANEGLDPGLICSIGPALNGLTAVNTNGAVVALHPNSVLVLRHDTLAYEYYFRGYDTHTLHPIASISKSVVALLAGIASDQGLLRRVDARVFSYFPNDSDLQSHGKDSITVRDLLTMISGLSWPELAVPYGDPSNIVRQMAHASDPYRFVLARPLAAPPGTAWNYNSGGVALLGDILMQVTHQPLDKFAQQALFGPLGIRDQDWAWVRVPNGDLAASGGLDLLPARYGEDRAARAEPWRLAWASDRLREMDQRDDEPAGAAVQKGP